MNVQHANGVLGMVRDPEDTPEYKAELKSAWWATAKRLHPDQNPDAPPDAGAKMAEAQAAYTFLLDVADGKVQPDPADAASEEDEIEELVQALLDMTKTIRKQDKRITDLNVVLVELQQRVARLERERPTAAPLPRGEPRDLRWDPEDEGMDAPGAELDDLVLDGFLKPSRPGPKTTRRKVRVAR